ncbi:MAG: signal peptidase II [Deltaproteobacteria bacterium]|nr:signal peptidase II [Deltaproteobacteria bacterium]
MKKYIIFTTIAVCVIFFDQYSKFLLLTKMLPYESIPVIDGFFNIVSIRNPGAAFGIFASFPLSWRMPLFIGVAILATAFIIYSLLEMGDEDKRTPVALSLIFAGMVGNTTDRLRFGEVIDFIDCYIGSWHWPAFNIADSALSLGAFLLLFIILKSNRRDGEKERVKA